ESGNARLAAVPAGLDRAARAPGRLDDQWMDVLPLQSVDEPYVPGTCGKAGVVDHDIGNPLTPIPRPEEIVQLVRHLHRRGGVDLAQPVGPSFAGVDQAVIVEVVAQPEPAARLRIGQGDALDLIAVRAVVARAGLAVADERELLALQIALVN